MNDKLKAVKITITYYGVGFTKDQAVSNAWNDISNDRDFQIAIIDTDDCELEDTNITEDFINQLIKGK
jgi:hypothetical protein